MGFRSTLAMQDYHGNIEWPDWFRDRYSRWLDPDGRLSVAQESKVYSEPFSTLPQDVQRALTESGWWDRPHAGAHPSLVYVWLHECGTVVLVEVTRDQVNIMQPEGWVPVDYPDPPDGQLGECPGYGPHRHSYDPALADTPRGIGALA